MTKEDREFRETVIADLATIRTTLQHIAGLPDRVQSLERDRARVLGAVAVLSAGIGVAIDYVRRHLGIA